MVILQIFGLQISGREMFEFNPDFVNEGEEIDGDVADSRLREKDENEVSILLTFLIAVTVLKTWI